MSEAPRYLTPPEYARRLGVDVGKVHGWIRTGELRAINTAKNGNGRPRWKIPPDCIVQFESAREAKPPAARPKRRSRQRLPAGFIAYF